jgi:tetratricopeptide (TPR) repeat protein
MTEANVGPEGLLASVVVSVAEKLVVELGRRGAAAVRGGPIDQAIAETHQRFEEVEVADALREWCESDEFRQLLDRFVTGTPSSGHAELVDSFLETSAFFLPGEERRSTASDIVAAFFTRLYHLLLLSPEGPVIAAVRDEALHLQGHQLTRTALTEVGEIKALLVEGQATAHPTNSQHAQIDAASELLKLGKPLAARTLLQRIKGSLSSDADSRVWMRVEANLAAAALATDDLDEARSRYAAALQHGEESRVLAIGAQVELAKGDADRGLELARRAWDAEQVSHSAAVLLFAMHQVKDQAGIRHLRNERIWIDADPQCLAVLGVTAAEDGRLVEALDYFRKSLAADPTNTRVRVQLAMNLVASVQQDIAGEPPLPWQMDPELLGRLEEAESLLTTSIVELDGQEPRDPHLEAVALRAITRGLLARPNDAVVDADYVLHERPHHYTALRTKGLALIGSKPDIAAEALAGAWAASQEEGMVGFALAHALRSTGQLQDATELLNLLIERKESSDRERIAALALLGELNHQMGNTAGMERTESRLINDWPDDPNAHVAAAAIARADGRLEIAIHHLEVALTQAAGNLRSQVAFELADAMIAAERFDDASTLLATLVDDSAPMTAKQRYAAALFNAGRLKEALLFSRRQRGEGDVLPVITEVEAWVLARIGDLPQAQDLFRRLGEKEHRPDHLLQAAGIAVQRRELGDAKELVQRVAINDVRRDAYQLMQLAQLRQAVGLPGALEAAYIARRRGYGDPKVHMAYLSVFLQRGADDAITLSPEEVGPDVSITLRGGGTDRVIRIEDDEPDRARGDVAAIDDLAERLRGAKPGDEVVISDDGITRVAYTVVELRHKYVEAFQETLTNFSTLFPGRDELRAISVAGDDFGGVFRLLDRQHSSTTQILQLYESRRAPVGMVARLLGRTPIEVASALRAESSRAIPVSTGQGADFAREIEAAASEDVVIDETGLLTIDDLALWDVVGTVYRRIKVPQQIVDELRTAIAENADLKPSGYMGKTEAGYFFRDIAEEELAAQQTRLDALMAAIEKHAEVSAPEGLLDLGGTTLAELTSTIGAGTLAAIHLARQDNTSLWADDLATRLLAQSEWHVSGTWTQPVLRRMLAEGALDRSKYADAIATMALWGFQFLLPEPNDLLSVIQSDVAGGNRTARVLTHLLGPDYARDYAVSLAVGILRGLFLMPITSERRALLIDLVLTSVTRGRSPSQTLNQLLTELWPRLRLMPLAQSEVAQVVRIWMGQRR